MTDDINEERLRDEADYLSFLPGQRLKKAREVRGLSVDEVAKELNLSLRFVNLMEADSYKELPEPAFVRGYMRRYAQLVKLSPDDIAGKFDQCYAADSETPPPDARPYNPVQLLGSIARRPRLRLGRLLSWASFALIVVLVAGFLWSGIHSGAVVPAAAPEPAAIPAVPAPLAAPVPATTQTVPSGTTIPASATAPAATPSVVTTTLAPGMNVLPVPAAASSLASGVRPTAAPVPVAASAAAVVANAATPAALPAVAATGPDSLTLALGAESWVSVQDAKRQSLLGALRPAGQITLKGESPFYVSIGKANAVTLVFNGKAVDLKPYTQGSVATLTLKR